MTEKALITNAMAQCLTLPTELSADEVWQNKRSPAKIKHTVLKAVSVSAAAIVMAVSLATAFLLFKDESSVSKQEKLSAVSQPVQSSSDTAVQHNGQLSVINHIASELADSPEQFYACCCLDNRQEHSETQFCKNENMTTAKVSAAAKTLGEHLQNAAITYLGSDKTVSSDVKLIFEQYAGVHFVNIYPCLNCDASFSKLVYTIKDGVGYLCAEQNGNDLQKTPRHYFSFTSESLPLSDRGDLRFADWETDETVKTITQSDDKQAVSVSNDDNTAGFSFNVNNSGQMPVVNITDLKLPENEKISGAKLEVHLCRKNGDSSVPIKAAVLQSELTTGIFDFSGYTSYISKKDIDGIMIQVSFSTDIHPAPEKDNNGQQSAYSLSAYFEVS